MAGGGDGEDFGGGLVQEGGLHGFQGKQKEDQSSPNKV